MRFLIYASILLLATSAYSAKPECEQSLVLKSPQKTQTSQILFGGVELFRRNNKIGLQQVGDLTLKKWVKLPAPNPNTKNYVGIASDQRLYQVIYYPDRVIAWLLGGNKEFQDITVYDNRLLVGIDRNLQIQIFSHGKWQRSPLPETLRRGILAWFGITAGTYQLLSLRGPDALGDSLLISSVVGGAAAFSTLFAMLSRFEDRNTFSDGMDSVGQVFLGQTALPAQLSDIDLNKYLQGEGFPVPDQDTLPPQLPVSATERFR